MTTFIQPMQIGAIVCGWVRLADTTDGKAKAISLGFELNFEFVRESLVLHQVVGFAVGVAVGSAVGTGALATSISHQNTENSLLAALTIAQVLRLVPEESGALKVIVMMAFLPGGTE
jgi:hypothetical protein